MITDPAELDALDALVAELARAGFAPGVTAWLGGEDTAYSQVRNGRITVVVLAVYGPWIVLTGPAAHSPHWPYAHAPVRRHELSPHEAIRVVLAIGSSDATETIGAADSEGWPQENPGS
ncbi:MAG: hypothetical protein ACRDQ5_04330 [Sciscionella sp.]